MRLVVIPGCHLIGLHFEASWNELSYEACRAWRSLFFYSPSIPSRVGDVFARVSLWENDGLHGEFIGLTSTLATVVPKGLGSLDIPGAKFLYERCLGTPMAIRETFGTMYAWARQRSLRTDEYRIDSGYQRELGPQSHHLYVRLSEQDQTQHHPTQQGLFPAAA
jgi:hypothetical protein